MRRLTCAILVALAAALLALPLATAAAAPSTTTLQRRVAQLERSNRLLKSQLAASRRTAAARATRIETLRASVATLTGERDRLQAALLGDLKAKVAVLTNSELYGLALDMVVALEDDCAYSGDITTVTGAGSATFTRVSGGC